MLDYVVSGLQTDLLLATLLLSILLLLLLLVASCPVDVACARTSGLLDRTLTFLGVHAVDLDVCTFWGCAGHASHRDALMNRLIHHDRFTQPLRRHELSRVDDSAYALCSKRRVQLCENRVALRIDV